MIIITVNAMQKTRRTIKRDWLLLDNGSWSIIRFRKDRAHDHWRLAFEEAMTENNRQDFRESVHRSNWVRKREWFSNFLRKNEGAMKIGGRWMCLSIPPISYPLFSITLHLSIARKNHHISVISGNLFMSLTYLRIS